MQTATAALFRQPLACAKLGTVRSAEHVCYGQVKSLFCSCAEPNKAAGICPVPYSRAVKAIRSVNHTVELRGITLP